MWISRGDDFLNLSDEEYDKQLKEAWENMSKDEKEDYKNNFMRFKLEMEEEDEEFFHLEDTLLEKFVELRKKFSGREITDEELIEIKKVPGIRTMVEEEGILSVYLDDDSLDEEAREQLNWEYSFDVDIEKK